MYRLKWNISGFTAVVYSASLHVCMLCRFFLDISLHVDIDSSGVAWDPEQNPARNQR
jgi:hypothetical protein